MRGGVSCHVYGYPPLHTVYFELPWFLDFQYSSHLRNMSGQHLPSKSSHEAFGKQVLTGSLATLAVITGEKLLLKIAKHPVLIFGLGMLGGAIVCKNRKAILSQGAKVLDAGKAIVLEQKEKFLDLVAEAKEYHDHTE